MKANYQIFIIPKHIREPWKRRSSITSLILSNFSKKGEILLVLSGLV